MRGEHGGSYLTVTLKNNDGFAVELNEEEQLEAAMEQYSQQVLIHPHLAFKDKLLTLRLYAGGHLRVAVSAILYIAENTPSHREAQWALEDAQTRRRKELFPEWGE